MSAVAEPLNSSNGVPAFAQHALYILRSNPVTGVAFGLFTLVVLCALFGPLIAPYDPLETNTARALQPPSWEPVTSWQGVEIS